MRAIEFAAWTRLQRRLQTMETSLMRRENVIRFLMARFLLMGSMVIGFWLLMRESLAS